MESATRRVGQTGKTLRRVVVVESDGKLANLIEVAIEHARPGTPVTVVARCAAAARLAELAKRAPALRPSIVILGPWASLHATNEQLSALRHAPLRETPVVALSLKGRRRAGLDAAYEYPFEWRALSESVATLLDDWLR